MKLFALEKLTEIDVDVFEHEYDLKRHVYALGKLAGRTAAQSRIVSKGLWASSKNATPQQNGERLTSPQPATPALEPASSPGPSHRDVVQAVESVARGFQGAMDSVIDRFTELQDRRGGEDYTTDKFQAISGLDFKRSPPIIRDDDPDLDRHDREFDNMVACYSFGSRKPREVDKLHMYATSFQDSAQSVRECAPESY